MDCYSCGATLMRTDRFCPACGTPNGATGLHPKLDTGRPVIDPFVRPDGSTGPSCPRCTGAIHRPQAFCPACGLQLDDVWVALDRSPVDGVWTTPGPRNLDPYRSLRVPTSLLVTVLWLASSLAVVAGVLHFWAAARIGGDLAGRGPETTRLLEWVRVVDVIGVACMVVAGVLLIAWMNRAYRNLPATAVTGLRLGPVWAVAGWFVPVANLVLPKLVMDDLWRANDPLARPRSTGWRTAPAPLLSALWWVCLILGTVLLAGAGLALPGYDLATGSGADLQSAMWLGGAAALVLLGSGLSLVVLVRRIADRAALRVSMLGAPAAIARLRPEPVSEESTPAPSLVRPAADLEQPVWGRY